MQNFHNLKLKNKIIFSFLLVLLVTLVLMAVAMNVFFANSTTQMADKYTLQGIQQVNASIEAHIENISASVDMLSKSTSIIEFLSWDTYLDTTHGLYTRSNIRNLFTSFVEASEILQGVMLVSASNFYISNEMYHDSTTPITNEEWYRACTAEGKLAILRLSDDRKQKYFRSQTQAGLVSLAIPLYLSKSSAPAGALLVDVNVGFLQSITEDISWDKMGYVLIMDRDGDIVYGPVNDISPRIRPEWFGEDGKKSFQKKINGQEYEFVFQASEITDWKAIGVFSRQKTLEPIISFRYFMVAILLITTSFAVVIVSLLSRTIVKPILRLNNLMQKAAAHDYSVHFDVDYDDEIGELGNSFNSMVDETQSLIEIVKAEQQQKRKAELQILHEQIKPHFLYNTFDTIHWIAKRYNADEVVDIIRSLTTFLRVGLSRGREVISVREEIEHVVSYLTIQQHRYHEKLKYRINVREGCEEYLVQKLVLQPLIENAIYHGIKEKEEAGMLLVQVYENKGTLVLAVTDNGNGIEPERLREIELALGRNVNISSVYGLINVNERIHLSYGNGYGIRLNTKKGYYTRAEILHPIICQKGATETNA